MILYNSFHTIDVDNGESIRRVVPQDFNLFINEYVSYATHNDSVKYYTTRNSHTTVVHCIEQLVQNCLDNNQQSENRLNEYSQAIADKLVYEEQQMQERIAATGTRIKKGCLVQAFICTEEQEYLYIIAKVEQTEFYDGESLQKMFGFPGEKKSVWKSAVFPLGIEDENLSFEPIRVYTDNGSKYWAMDFLELTEKRNDRDNTKVAYAAINQELKRRVRNISERDYFLLSNSFYQNLRSNKLINYPSMVENMLNEYQPYNENVNIENVKNALLTLPECKKFDAQFNSVPEALDKDFKLKYKIMPNVELNIKGSIHDFRGAIVAYTDTQGTQYIRIRCSEPRTFDAFSS